METMTTCPSLVSNPIGLKGNALGAGHGLPVAVVCVSKETAAVEFSPSTEVIG
jgi:hypothetical protein